MDREASQVGLRLVDRVVVRGAGTVGLVGALIFFIVGVPAIGIYLALAGIAFWVFSLGWRARYENVLESAPEGFQPTGEVFVNPGGSPVAVYFQGIRRVYVKKKG